MRARDTCGLLMHAGIRPTRCRRRSYRLTRALCPLWSAYARWYNQGRRYHNTVSHRVFGTPNLLGGIRTINFNDLFIYIIA
jgi:hypothetical protein